MSIKALDNGARLGRGVYINSLAINDHNLLHFGNRVVIGDGVHLSGHTVEHGVVRTARVRLGDEVTIGLGTVVGIGVEAGARAHVGALSFVSKFSRLAVGSALASMDSGDSSSVLLISGRSRTRATTSVTRVCTRVFLRCCDRGDS
jgi:tetrahydrodipicolinate N-succinyltransferase